MEAEAFVREQEAGFVERNLGAAAVEEGSEPIFVGEFNRMAQELTDVLKDGPALRSCRQSLQEHGYDSTLPSGVRIFVHPYQYEQVLQLATFSRYNHRHVIVSASFEFLLEQDLQLVESNTGTFKGAWIKSRQQLERSSDGSNFSVSYSGEGQVMRSADNCLARLAVQRSFLCSAPSRRRPTSVTQSATASLPGHNPRCVDFE